MAGPAALPEVAPGRLGRQNKLALLAFSTLSVALLLVLRDGGAVTPDGLALALAPLLAWPIVVAAVRAASRGAVLAVLIGATLLFAAAVSASLQGTRFPVGAAPGTLALVMLALGGALALGAPLRYFLLMFDHPDAALRATGAFGLATVSAAAAALAWRPLGIAPLLMLGYPAMVAGLYALALQAERVWLARGRRRGARLSVAIICKDEADRIARCLEGVHGWADEIVVLDSGSSDGTVEVVRRYTDRVWVTDWPGFGVQKQRALERCTGDWVLSLDADELLDDDVRREIDARIASAGPRAGFRMLRVSIVFGGVVEFGADGDHHVRLFRRDRTRWDGAPVHEDVIVDGPLGRMWRPFYHLTFRDFAHLRRKFGDYAWLQARARHARGRRASAPGALLRGIVSFPLFYIWRFGLLDGARGLIMAALYAHYTFDKYAALWSLSVGRSPPAARPDAR